MKSGIDTITWEKDTRCSSGYSALRCFVHHTSPGWSWILSGLGLPCIQQYHHIHSRSLLIKSVIKSTPILFLAAVVFSHSDEESKSPLLSLLVSFGLVLSAVGDISLAIEPSYPHFFLVGLAAFLCAHVCYIIAFTRTKKVTTSTIIAGIPIVSGSVASHFCAHFLLFCSWCRCICVLVSIHHAEAGGYADPCCRLCARDCNDGIHCSCPYILHTPRIPMPHCWRAAVYGFRQYLGCEQVCFRDWTWAFVCDANLLFSAAVHCGWSFVWISQAQTRIEAIYHAIQHADPLYPSYFPGSMLPSLGLRLTQEWRHKHATNQPIRLIFWLSYPIAFPPCRRVTKDLGLFIMKWVFKKWFLSLPKNINRRQRHSMLKIFSQLPQQA